MRCDKAIRYLSKPLLEKILFDVPPQDFDAKGLFITYFKNMKTGRRGYLSIKSTSDRFVIENCEFKIFDNVNEAVAWLKADA